MEKFHFLHTYHTHTVYCNHAYNTVEENILAAIKYGYKTIGFSEHAPLNSVRPRRLNFANVQQYINEVNAMKEKYKDKIEVLVGFEAEYHQDEYEYYKKLRNMVDYMILGNHNLGNPHDLLDLRRADKIDLNLHLQQFIDGMKSGLFSAVAHPDYVFNYVTKWDDDCIKFTNELIKAAIQYDIPIGFNINGLLHKEAPHQYPNDYFWKLVSKSKCKVIIEPDAHDVSTMNPQNVSRAFALAKEWNLEKNLVSSIIIK